MCAALLRRACKEGRYNTVLRLLTTHPNIGVDAVRIGGSGKTALYLAAERGHLPV